MPHRQISWLPGALQDLRRLREFIQSKNPAAAKKAAYSIKEALAILQENPKAGMPLFEALQGFHDLMVPFGRNGYIVRYREDGDGIVIVRVWHTREDRP